MPDTARRTECSRGAWRIDCAYIDDRDVCLHPIIPMGIN